MSDERLKTYEVSDVAYALQKLIEARYIKATKLDTLSQTMYMFTEDTDGITYEGHRYLDAIRADGVWSKVKATLSKVGGSAPFGMVLNLAEELLKRTLFG